MNRVRIIVTGSRAHTDQDLIWTALAIARWELGPITVVHGSAPGADSIASQWVRTHAPHLNVGEALPLEEAPKLLVVGEPEDIRPRGQAVGRSRAGLSWSDSSVDIVPNVSVTTARVQTPAVVTDNLNPDEHARAINLTDTGARNSWHS